MKAGASGQATLASDCQGSCMIWRGRARFLVRASCQQIELLALQQQGILPVLAPSRNTRILTMGLL